MFSSVDLICIHFTCPSILPAIAGAPCAVKPDKFVKFKPSQFSIAIIPSSIFLVVCVSLSMTKEAIASVILQFLSTPMDKDGYTLVTLASVPS